MNGIRATVCHTIDQSQRHWQGIEPCKSTIIFDKGLLVSGIRSRAICTLSLNASILSATVTYSNSMIILLSNHFLYAETLY